MTHRKHSHPYSSSAISLFKSSACEFLYMIHLFNFSKHSMELTLSSLEYPFLSISFHVPGCLSYSPLQYQHFFIAVQSLSCVLLFVTPWTVACQASLSITNSWSLSKLMYIESVMPSNHLILCRPLLLPPSTFPSIRGSFQMSQLFASGGQNIGVSGSTSVPPMNTQD